jgi:hypothetical protein
MTMVAYLFPLSQLKKMDKHQLEMLHSAIQHHVHTSPEIRKILRAKVRPVYDKLRQPEGRRQGTRAGRSKA